MKKPIDEIADRLAERVRTDASGAKSLGHLLVVVPTAQSGRRLRLKLAERLGAFISPEIRLPPQLVVPDARTSSLRSARRWARRALSTRPRSSPTSAASSARTRCRSRTWRRRSGRS